MAEVETDLSAPGSNVLGESRAVLDAVPLLASCSVLFCSLFRICAFCSSFWLRVSDRTIVTWLFCNRLLGRIRERQTATGLPVPFIAGAWAAIFVVGRPG